MSNVPDSRVITMHKNNRRKSKKGHTALFKGQKAPLKFVWKISKMLTVSTCTILFNIYTM